MGHGGRGPGGGEGRGRGGPGAGAGAGARAWGQHSRASRPARPGWPAWPARLEWQEAKDSGTGQGNRPKSAYPPEGGLLGGSAGRLSACQLVGQPTPANQPAMARHADRQPGRQKDNQPASREGDDRQAGRQPTSQPAGRTPTQPSSRLHNTKIKKQKNKKKQKKQKF